MPHPTPAAGQTQRRGPVRRAEDALRLVSIRSRLIACFCGMLLFLLAVAGLGVWQMFAIEQGRGAAGAATATQGMELLLGACAVFGMLQFSFCYLLTASIVRPVKVAMKSARKVGNGDLTVQVRPEGRDELAELFRGVNEMTHNLRELVSQVAGGAQRVADTSSQIARGNLDLSQRTEEQASTLEETASSMEQLTATVGQNAERAREANQLAVNASQAARKGGEVVDQVVNTMDEILDSSKKISDIISVIDGIAFQTNILALNAAVEAARAGEQGRGFAVVAAEVRNLAQRSAAAAKETKGLIGDAEHKVQAGASLVDAAGHTMVDVVLSFQRVSDLIAEIAAASQEQSTGIGQVNTAITQMDQVVQQNASLVEEATAATESMKDQARSLLQTVARFNLGGAQRVQEVVLKPIVTRAPLAPAIQTRPSANLPAFEKADRKLVGNGEWKEF
jgi:methyl-accepting chemotaxis protein